MNFCIRLNQNEIITLPADKNLQERIELCDRLINEFSDYFYQQPSTEKGFVGSSKVCARLEAMANYILNGASNDSSCVIMSEYKDKLIKNSEIPFSTLENRYNYSEKQ